MSKKRFDGQFDGEAAFTTVGELRELLAGIDAKVPITIEQVPGRKKVLSLVLLTSIDRKGLFPWLRTEEERKKVRKACIVEVA